MNRDRVSESATDRGQANLFALATALLLLTGAVVVGLGVATGAFAAAQRTPAARASAAGVAERLVAPDGPLAARRNVLRREAIEDLNRTTLRMRFPGAARRGVRVTVDGETIARAGTVDGGASVRRLVRVERRETATVPDAFANGTRRTLPARSDAATLVVTPQGVDVRTVRVNGHVALHDPAGLDGQYSIDLPAGEPATLSVDRGLPPGTVRIRYHPLSASPAVLGVTVDA